MGQKSIPSLDGLRAVSIFIVIAAHVGHGDGVPAALSRVLNALFMDGVLGVKVFFVISGFLITTLLLKEKVASGGQISIRNFYVRRVLRIFPVHYLYIGVILWMSSRVQSDVTPGLLAHAVTYTMNFAVTGTWVLGHLWSLGVEEQFYLFWPWVVRRSRKGILGGAVAILLYAPIARALGYAFPQWNLLLLAPFFSQADGLMMGALAAVAVHERPAILSSPLMGNALLRAAAVVVMWGVGYLSFHGRVGILVLPLGGTVVSACAVFLLVSVISGRKDHLHALLNHPWVAHVGVLSYSLYVWQQVFLFPSQWVREAHVWRQFPLNVILVFLCAAGSYHLWERPFLRWKERFSRTGQVI